MLCNDRQKVSCNRASLFLLVHCGQTRLVAKLACKLAQPEFVGAGLLAMVFGSESLCWVEIKLSTWQRPTP